MTDKLKPCPFCGGNNVGVFKHEYFYKSHLYAAHCYDCHFGLKMVETEEEAITTWNTRKPMDRIAEKLEEEVTEIGSRVCNNTKCNHECVNNAGMCDHGVLMGAIINAIREGVQNE